MVIIPFLNNTSGGLLLNMEQNYFNKLSKLQEFQLHNFTWTWSNERKMNGSTDMTYSNVLQQRVKILDKFS